MKLLSLINIGYLAASLVIITPIPQLYKIIKTKSSKDISIVMYVILLVAQILFTIYGVLEKDYVIIVTNVSSVFIIVLIIIASLYYSYNINSPSASYSHT
jgi:MtN3 and saliva related transmembrane protein